MTENQVAAQLYTVRSLCQTPEQTKVTLEKIRSIGYAGIEVAGICPIDPEEMAKMAIDSNLTIVSIHDRKVFDNPREVVDKLNVLDCEYAACSLPAGIDVNLKEDVFRLVEMLATAGASLRNSGKTFSFHHHSHEFIRFGGKTLLDHLLDTVDPSDLSLELDTYWIQHGGGTICDWLEQRKGRVPVIHLKDYGIIGGNPQMMEIGNGNLNWRKIIPSAEASSVKWFVVEQDVCQGDPLDSLSISYDYLRTNFIR